LINWLVIMMLGTLLALVPTYGRAQSPGKSDPTPAIQTNRGTVEGETAGAKEHHTLGERRAYEKKTAEALAGIEEKVSDLRIKARKVAPQQKRMMVMVTNNLYALTLSAQNRLTALKKAPEKDWNGARAELDRSMLELEQTVAAVEMKLK
jgi:hypothetical protein